MGAPRRSPGLGRPAWALAHYDVRSRAAEHRAGGAIDAGRADEQTGFLAYVEQFLAPTLQHGDVVVMDNLAVHKMEGVKEAIRAVGASVLHLLPYLPDLNPIEPVFAKLKALLRSAAARTKDALWATIGRMLNRFSPAKCRNHLANSGYEFTDGKNALEVQRHRHARM